MGSLANILRPWKTCQKIDVDGRDVNNRNGSSRSEIGWSDSNQPVAKNPTSSAAHSPFEREIAPDLDLFAALHAVAIPRWPFQIGAAHCQSPLAITSLLLVNVKLEPANDEKWELQLLLDCEKCRDEASRHNSSAVESVGARSSASGARIPQYCYSPYL